MRGSLLWVLGVVLSVLGVEGLENGLARTPPMGWLAWQRFRCNTDCVNDPHNCIRCVPHTSGLDCVTGVMIFGIKMIMSIIIKQLCNFDVMYHPYHHHHHHRHHLYSCYLVLLPTSESLFMQMSDLLVHEGYRDLGYNLISLDDCWMARNRDAQGRLQSDPYRFPSGIKALGDYVSFLPINTV